MVFAPILSSIPSVTAAAKENAASLRAAGQAMAELGAAGCVGAGCVRFDLITPESVRVLSRSVFSMFLPMFLGTSIARTVSTYGLNRSSLTVPLVAVLHCAALFFLSRYLLLPLFGMDYESDDESGRVLSRATAVGCSFGNSGVVPLLFAEALFRAPFEPSSMFNQCIGYISLYLVGWSPFFWSFGRSILVGDSEGEEQSGIEKSLSLMKFKQLFPPPVVGVAIGLFVATTPLRHLFLSKSGEAGAPFVVVYNCFQNLGRAASPMALLVLTSSLALGSRSGQNSEEERRVKVVRTPSSKQDTGPNPKGVGTLQRWACVSTSRFILSPLLMTIFLKSFNKIGMLSSAKDDPALW
eukprot:CAMPEP_0113553888 /NCGR_PEP_ID=MMETSP0015_2-20120614/15852_1 /TAXON_ID=2838 /ORGANISM="Odontella" /LENGTH=352 /DNA_ID=CAMNT_0000454985 /DNA_START=221 /DNA_END=1276 /DNA_ORIENTATION=- /assembly_acc=CAM_ASM_000160